MVKSNNDPKIPARLFLDAVSELKGCPLIVRSDCGTENGIVAAIQCFSGLVVWMHLLEKGLTFMVHPTPTNELKAGGPF